MLACRQQLDVTWSRRDVRAGCETIDETRRYKPQCVVWRIDEDCGAGDFKFQCLYTRDQALVQIATRVSNFLGCCSVWPVEQDSCSSQAGTGRAHVDARDVVKPKALRASRVQTNLHFFDPQQANKTAIMKK